ncbi:MAG: anti-sigma F factor [Clostridia bacterium]|nr:anti-sigma F factor [Clostridia bacterium]MDD4375973.1 anti-sigma F factor [Clostridia bacterium]
MENNIKIEIDNKLCNVSVVRVAITSLISQKDVPLDEITEIKTAISEAVTNCIEHAYEEENQKVVISAKLSTIDDMDFLLINIEDFGIGIEDVDLATTPGYTTKPELEHAGMGFTIMETFMDEITIDSKMGSGTKIKLMKKLRTRKVSNI